MKKLLVMLVPLLLVVVGFSGGITTIEQEALNDRRGTFNTNNEVDLEKGLEVVIVKVRELSGEVKTSPDNTKAINKIGKSIEENWDMIEKQVEKKYPEDYKNIEESLYPLIGIAKHDSPDVNKLKRFINETEKKLDMFKGKVSK